ncbi:Asp-tRNA(Asn)/Glu-tRNA(Gln) amidotransferase subunit GatA [Candidatus Dependentiae bacterium]|nr:Asp-tRNA(Asn)/Glu-tRNA(Gln) amidotransferase subunit GatA [Candidatus Dependentiae bacterium]MCC7414711.1 Asp-tRNA(Asn)/Glu-tRNA(Gln) amidotransferase subunit GatA [Campylobacterota bacterium]
MNFAFATIKELRTALRNKQLSYKELRDACLARFAQHDPTLESALELFDAQSIELPTNDDGILAGIPGIIKDNISQKDRKLTCASKILENYRALYDATAIARLKKEGALLVGRANMDEFAMGSSTETSAFAKTKNPWNLSRVPGGSSGGSAAAVAAGLVPWSLGSSTGGSVRQPAAFCGIVGFKPTYGLVSRYGLVAYASSLDQIGVCTRTVYDNALVLSAIAGKDARDSSTLDCAPQDFTQSLDGSIKPRLKIGIVENALHADGMHPEIVAAIESAIAVYERMGAEIVRLKLPTLDYSAATYFIISRAEAASNLARFDGVRYGVRDKNAQSLDALYSSTRSLGFGDEVKTRIMVGNYVLSAGHSGAFYDNAKKVQRLMRSEFADTFKKVDLLLMPTHPTPAFSFGAFDHDKLQMDLQDYFTCAANLAGIPAISLPCGFVSEGLPIGFQLVGPHVSEELLYQTAHAYEQQTAWHTMHPEGF